MIWLINFLILQNLPHIGIEGVFRHIPEDLYLLFWFPAGEYALLLFRLPASTGSQMMKSDQPVLNIGSAQLWR